MGYPNLAHAVPGRYRGYHSRWPLTIISIYVRPGDYKFNIKEVFDLIEPKVKSYRFVAGGDLNAARHLDDIYGGQWYHRFFNSITERGFHD
jgi:hypothetical protein